MTAPKPWTTAQARATLAGFRAALIDDDHGQPMLVVCRWNLTRSFSDLAEFDVWLTRATGKGA